MIDTAVSFKSSHAHNDAYKRAMGDLEKAVEQEDRYRKDTLLNMKLQDQAEHQEKNLKQALAQHHTMVLQQQVEERKAAKEAEVRERQMPDINPMFHGYPNLPQTPFDRARVNQKGVASAVKTDLELQMLDNERIKEHRKNEERMLDNYRAEMAKVSLENDLKALNDKHALERDILRNAWQEDLDMKQLKSNIGKLEKGLAMDSRVTTPYSMRSHDPGADNASQIAESVPEVDEENDEDEDANIELASQSVHSPKGSVAPSQASVARSKASVASTIARQKQLEQVIAYSTSSKREQNKKDNVSRARDDQSEIMSNKSSRSHSASIRSARSSRFKNIGAASIFSARSSRAGSSIMTPSSKLQQKLAALDNKEKEINNRKAKIRNMLNQELDMSNVPSAAGSVKGSITGSLNKTTALDTKSKPFYTEKVKPPSVVDRKSKRPSNQSIKDSVSDLMKTLF